MYWSESGDRIRVVNYSGDVRQKWMLCGNKIVNAMFSDECIGLKKGILMVQDDADVIATKYQGKPYQHWRVEYVWPADNTVDPNRELRSSYQINETSRVDCLYSVINGKRKMFDQ